MTGQLLKDKLATLPISFRAIADAIGIPAQQLNRIFLQDDIKTGVLEKICETQGLTMSFFYPSDGIKIETNVNRVRAQNINTVSGDIGGDANNSNGVTAEMLMSVLQQNQDLINMLKNK